MVLSTNAAGTLIFKDNFDEGFASKNGLLTGVSVPLNGISTTKHVASWSDLTIDLTAADVNVDGAVNLTDASNILKVVAGWKDVVLGPQA